MIECNLIFVNEILAEVHLQSSFFQDQTTLAHYGNMKEPELQLEKKQFQRSLWLFYSTIKVLLENASIIISDSIEYFNTYTV